MMRYYRPMSERHEEYKTRVERVKKRHPDVEFRSDKVKTLLCISMYLRYYSGAMNMAAELGDTQLCKEIYSENERLGKYRDVINISFSKYKDNPLMNAVWNKRLGTAEWLLQHGAKILPNRTGWNPVLWACDRGCIPALNMFRYYDVDFNQGYAIWRKPKKIGFPKKEVLYPLAIACIAKQPKTVHWLLEHGASIDGPFYENMTVREIIDSPEIDAETRGILAKKAAETPMPIKTKKSTFWKRIVSGRA